MATPSCLERLFAEPSPSRDWIRRPEHVHIPREDNSIGRGRRLPHRSSRSDLALSIGPNSGVAYGLLHTLWEGPRLVQTESHERASKWILTSGPVPNASPSYRNTAARLRARQRPCPFVGWTVSQF